MPSTVDVSVTTVIDAPPDRVRRIMFDPRQDPTWMAAVKQVDVLSDDMNPGARARRTGKFLARTIRWTTEVRFGSRVTIRNVGLAPGFAPRWLLAAAMRRSLSADLRRLKGAAET